jgi:signal transduction histidine kinase
VIRALRETVVVRGLADFRMSNLSSHLREPRFWLIQALVVGIAVGHWLLEVLEQNGELGPFAEGILHLPAPTNMIPVVLAALWYGVEGGVLTGLGASVIGSPNLVLFHADDWEWVGELLAYAGVLVVAVIVAVMAEREAEVRRRNEASLRRLDTIRDVAQVLADHDEATRLVQAVLTSLTEDGGFEAAGFMPTTGVLERPIIMGSTASVPIVAASLGTGSRPASEGETITAVVRAGSSQLGTLAAIPGPGPLESYDEAMLELVAQELGVAIQTIALRNRQRAELEHYARAITMAQEAERQRVARDLHDETAQSMVLLIRGISRLDVDDTQSSEVGELRELAQRTLSSIRATILELRPPLLDDLGLPAALESLLERRTRREGCALTIEVVGAPRRVDPDVELALYRTAQEAISNVVRHSGATSSRILVEFGASHVAVEVGDDGSGFDSLASGAIGLGITGMRERARIVGGELTIDTTPGRGTTIRLEVGTA